MALSEDQKRLLMKILKENKYSLYIGRLRLETKRKFVEIANKEFCSDYGLFLEHLMTFWLSNKDKLTNDICKKIDEIIERLEKIEKIVFNPIGGKSSI